MIKRGRKCSASKSLSESYLKIRLLIVSDRMRKHNSEIVEFMYYCCNTQFNDKNPFIHIYYMLILTAL
jgi:hypothetical protein